MIPVKVTIRSDDNGVSPHLAEGFAPFIGSPLAVVNVHEIELGQWTVDVSRWHVVHTPTGYFLGAKSWEPEADAPPCIWADREFAFGVLNRCNAAFPAWLYAKGGHDMATLACRAMFRAAVLGGGSA